MNRWIGGGIVVVFLAAGCSDGPRIVQIEGTATRKGQPVPNITVFFMPIIEGRRSWAITDEEGKFKLTNSAEVQGVPVGKHKVSVAFRPKDPKEELDIQSGRKKLHPEQQAILKKYAVNPGIIEVEIKEGNQKVHLELD